MADVHTKEVRSFNMSQIKGKNTKPEMLVRKFLFANGLRYRLHKKDLPGKPDLVLPKFRSIVFVHGCFWHGHEGCKYFVIPKTNSEWWLAKIMRNRERDQKAQKELENMGWNVFYIWECELKNNANATLTRLLANIKST